MKSKQDIERRVRDLMVAELERRVAAANEKLPTHCVYNIRHSLDARKTVDGEPNPNYNRISAGKQHLPVVQTIGLCGYGMDKPESWNGDICEDPIDAQRCDLFKAKRGKDEIWAELIAQYRTPGWVFENLPEVAGLVWALDQGIESADAEAARVTKLVEKVKTLDEAPPEPEEPEEVEEDAGIYIRGDQVAKALVVATHPLPWWQKLIFWLFRVQTLAVDDQSLDT